MNVKMSYKSKPNNGVNEAQASSESVSPNRCPIGKQDGPGPHTGPQTTADRRTMRRLWS